MSQTNAREQPRPRLLPDVPATPPLPTAGFLSKARHGIGRLSLLKVAAALAILAVAGVTLAPTLIYAQSDEALTNAPVATLRSAIPGIVERVAVTPGQTVAVGDLIAIVRNPLADPALVIDIDGRLRVVRSRLETAIAEAARLRVVQARLEADFDLWQDAQGVSIDLKRRQASAERQAAIARLAATAADLRRYEALKRRGFATSQRLEQAVRDRDVATEGVLSAELGIAREDQGLQAVAQGFTLGDTDRSPTRQRIDEIDIRLANLDAAAISAVTDVHALEYERVLRVAQLERESVSELRATTGGVVWRVFAGAGEQVDANAPIVNLVDSGRMVVTAVFRQRHADGLKIGRAVSIHVIGNDLARTGRIAEVSGYYASDQRVAMAVVMRPDKEATVLATIVLDDPLQSALVGLQATVRLDR